MIVYVMPRFLAFTIPVGVLLTVLIAFGRMNGDSEIIALKTSGVSLGSLLKPTLLIAVLLTAATGYITLYALPQGNRALEAHLFQLASSRAALALTPGVFSEDFGGFVVYVEEIDEETGELRRLMLHDTRTLERPVVIFARRGRMLDPDEEERLLLRLEEGELHATMPGDPQYQLLRFDTYEVGLALGEDFAMRLEEDRDVREYTMGELEALIAEQRAAGEYPGDALVEYHERFSLPFVCVVFAVLGIPLAVGPTRSGRSTGFIVGLLVTVFCFVSLRGAEALGRGGTVPAWLALWLPNLALGSFGIYLFRLASRERRFPPLEWIDRVGIRLAARLARRKAAP
jgi:lipopolysaccharide export system permease protein